MALRRSRLPGRGGSRPRPVGARLRRRCARLRGDGGYSTVEAAITLPALITLTMVVVQWALVWHASHVAQAAAQEGLRAGRGYQATAEAGRVQAENYLQAVAPTMLTSTSVSASRDATTVTVNVHADVIAIIPFGTFDVTEQASGPVERFVPPGSGG